jgi:pyruvate dehydrogenase E2 component (dihydrolipoamide acetyltransferase)
MAFSVVMPALEMAQETGKLLAWRKQEGDRVAKGEPLLEVETDKAVVEVESPADGILAGIKAAPGADIPVGQIIAWIVAPGEEPPVESESTAPAARAGSHARVERSPLAAMPAGSPLQAPTASTKVSPKARRLAQELGVDLAKVRASGPGGEVLASDVQAAGRAPTKSAEGERESGSIEIPTSLGRVMAERTTESWTTVPHFFLSREIEATGLNDYRERVRAEIESLRQVRITHTDLLVALVSRVLLKHPRLNASWRPEGIRLHAHVNMGIAIAVEDGVAVGVVHNAHNASLAEIAIQRREVAERARAGKLRPADIADATFTISNLGMYQVDQFSAIIPSPQAAILAVGGIADRVIARQGQPAVRSMMILTISCDHRVADGARAALFLSQLAEATREPAKLLQ